MAYDIQTTYNSFGGGISDDAFIWPVNSVADMDSIDVQTNDRYCTAINNYVESGEYDKYWWDYTWIKTTPYWSFRWNTSETLNPTWVQLSATIGTVIDWMESYWSGTDQVNYFFWRTTGIKKTNYLGTTLTTTITSWYPTWVNSEVTAIGWHQANVLFSKLNKVYYLNTATDTCSDAITLPPWTVVKLIYAYSSDSVVVFATSDDDTIAYELQFSGSTYSLVAEIQEKEYKCLKAVGDKYNVYWISTSWLHQYQGRQFSDWPIKSITLWSTAKIGFYRWVIIGNWTDVYSYGNKKSWRNKILTKISVPYTVDAMDRWDILCTKSTKSVLLVFSTWYKRTNTITLRPLDWWSYETPKHDLNYRFWYIFPTFSSYTNSATRCSIVVKVMTDEMERVNSSTYVTVGTYTTDSYWYIEITSMEVAQALATAGYKSEFWYARTNIELLAGDEYTSPTWFYRKTPKLFDFTIYANYVKR